MSAGNVEERAGGSAGEAWLAVSDGLVAGVHHALNNRLGTMSALAQLVAMGGTPRTDTQAALRQELDRFGNTLRLLGFVPRRPEESQIPLALPELLADLLSLTAQHRDVRDVEFAVTAPPDLLPVLCPETALSHALLALLVSAGIAARDGGSTRVEVRCSGDERFVTVEVVPGGTAEGRALWDAGIEALFAAAGGEAKEAGAGMVACLPTLVEGRKE